VIPRRKAFVQEGEFAWLRKHAGDTDRKTVENFEKSTAERIGVSQAAAVSSGRLAMEFIFRSLGLGQGDEVIVPAYTLGALLPFLDGLGLKPVPADIDPETMNVNPACVEARINNKTRAVLALHAFGAPCEIERLTEICRDKNLALVEDCAHALGAEANGRAAGSFGSAAFFSFETTKPINAYGGGMAVSSNEEIVEFVRKAAATGTHDPAPVLKKAKAVRTEGFLFSSGLAFPALYLLATPSFRKITARLYRSVQTVPRGDSVFLPAQAEIGLKKLESLNQRINERRRIAELYRQHLSQSIQIQKIQEDNVSTWYFLIALLPCPAASVRKKLLMRGIDAGVGDEIADDCARLLGYSDCPNTSFVFERAMALPMFDGISDEEVKKAAATLNGLI